MKSNIKSKKYYAEGENLSEGWGHYMKSIDILKDKVQNQEDITLKDVCWILYGEGWCSSYWKGFETYCISKKYKNRKMMWECWKGLFDKWYKTTYPPKKCSHKNVWNDNGVNICKDCNRVLEVTSHRD